MELSQPGVTKVPLPGRAPISAESVAVESHPERAWQRATRLRCYQWSGKDRVFHPKVLTGWCSTPSQLRPFARQLVRKIAIQNARLLITISTAQLILGGRGWCVKNHFF